MTTGAAAGVRRGHSELHSHSQEPGEAEAARGGVGVVGADQTVGDPGF